MKAAVLRKAGAPLDIDDITLAPLPAGYVRVRVAASGVCHSDLSMQDGTIPHPTPLMAEAGSLDLGRLITRRIQLEQVNEALQAMVDGEVARSVITFPVN